MSKDDKGFFDDLLDSFTMGMIIEASKDKDGKVNRDAAAGMAMSMGYTSFDDAIELEAMMDYEGAPRYGETDGFTGFQHEYNWRDYCEDGWEYGIDCNDYATEEEYEEALNEAKYSWRENCIDNEYDIDPEDYETEEEYESMIDACEEAVREYEESVGEYEEENDNILTIPFEDSVEALSDSEYEQKREARRKIIAGNQGKILAINYLTGAGQFLYSKAVKENFTLPISLPEETYCREYELVDIICKIAKRDEALSLKVWSWCVEQFLPYAQWDDYAIDDMTNVVIDKLYRFPESYRKTLAHYMDEHTDFRTKIATSAPGVSRDMPSVIVAAIQEELFHTAKELFESSYAKIKDDWKEVIDFVNEILWKCKNYDELESIEYFEKELFPVVKSSELGMVKDEIEEWEKDIASYIENVEESCEKYEFSRRNAWRRKVPDGSIYDMDPRDYSSKEEYMERYEWHKYGWRTWYCKGIDLYGLDVNAYETMEEFRQALDARREEIREKKQKQKEIESAEILEDKNIYTYCGVMLPHSGRPYSYRTEDATIQVGDIVCVPVGKDAKEVKGIVVYVGQYARTAVPYPVEQTRFIIRKV